MRHALWTTTVRGTVQKLVSVAVISLVILVSIAFLDHAPCFAATPEPMAFGGAGWDGLWSLESCLDGGWILVGGTKSFGAKNDDLWIVKLDSAGVVSWQKRLGGAKDEDAGGVWPVVQTSEGGYLVVGYTDSFGAGQGDGWVVKLNSSGEVEWEKTLGGIDLDYLDSVRPTADGGCILAGGSWSFDADRRGWLVKLKADGQVQWQRAYGSQATSGSAYLAKQTSDGGYVLLGDGPSRVGRGNFLYWDTWCANLHAYGNIRWQRAISTRTAMDQDSSCRLWAVLEMSSGGFLLAGSTSFWSPANEYTSDALVVRIDGSGDLRWFRTYGGDDSDTLLARIESIRGGFLLAGSTWSFGNGQSDGWVLRITPGGAIKSQACYGGTFWDGISDMKRNPDNSYALLGWTSSFAAGKSDALFLRVLPDLQACSHS